MFIEADPFHGKNSDFDPADILPPAEGDLEFIKTEINATLASHPSAVETVSSIYSGSFKDLSFSVQSSRSFSSQAASAERVRASVRVGTSDQSIEVDSSLARGHNVSISGESIDSDSAAALAAHAVFSFIRGELEGKKRPDKLARPEFRDALTSLYFNTKNIIGSSFIQEGGYCNASVSSDDFFKKVPHAITDAIQATRRGEFVTSYQVVRPFRGGEVSVAREESVIHRNNNQSILPASYSVDYSSDKQIWDPIATIESKETHKLSFALLEEVPRYSIANDPYGDVRFKPGFDRPPFSNGYARAKELKMKYASVEEREACRGDFRKFKELLALVRD